jgi:hypothetical protein
MQTDVTAQVIGSRELLSALVAHERLLAGMQQSMSVEMIGASELLTAFGAHELLVAVRGQVSAQLVRRLEQLVAEVALTKSTTMK